MEKLWFILHLIMERGAFLDSVDGFVIINRKTLQQSIGWESAQTAMGTLEEAGFIESDHSWQADRKSLGWRLTAWAVSLPRDVQFTTEPFWHAFFDGEQTKLRNALVANPAHEIIYESLDQLSLHPASKMVLPEFDGDGATFRRKRFAWERSVQKIADHQWWFKWDHKTGRVFNNITSLPKVLRPYACLCGDPCVEIDVANSQPFLLASLYPAASAEKTRYVEIVCGGSFYETVGAAAGIDWQQGSKGRAWLKEQVFTQVLFGRPLHYLPLWKGFCRIFPELGALILAEKMDDHAKLALRLQRAEASIMLGGAVPELEEVFPSLPMLTIHDSLLVPMGYASVAEEVIRRHFTAAIGSEPTLRRTPPALQLLG